MNCEHCGGPLVAGVCGSCGVAVVDATGTFKLDPASADAEIANDIATLESDEAALVVLKGPQAGEVWVLDGDSIDIGRSEDSTLFLDDVTVSRRHAVLRRAGDVWSVEDLGSLNGTYVNHEAISGAVQLQTGAELQVGKFRFKFHAGSQK